jgi:hypothetical protein
MIVSSIRKLAAELGISHTMLNRRYAKGHFGTEPGGGFDVDKVRVAMTRNTDIAQPSQAKRSRRAAEFGIGSEEPSGSSYELFNRARALKEAAIAKERQLDLRKRQGELVEVEEVRMAWSNHILAAQDRLLGIAGKLAPRVIAAASVQEAQELIENEIRQALTSLSEYQPNEA